MSTPVSCTEEKKMSTDQGPTDRAIIHARYHDVTADKLQAG